MKTIGFPISHKENENRRALIPTDVSRLVSPNNIYIETGFGEVLGISDDEYAQQGCNICSHEEVLIQSIICDPKIGDADYLEHRFHFSQKVCGDDHAVGGACHQSCGGYGQLAEDDYDGKEKKPEAQGLAEAVYDDEKRADDHKFIG